MDIKAATVVRYCEQRRYPEPDVELCFASPRRFRFDLAWPVHFVALEFEGGVWTGGRHVSPQGFLRDLEKYNLAAQLGWRVFRATPEMVESGMIFNLLDLIFGGQ